MEIVVARNRCWDTSLLMVIVVARKHCCEKSLLGGITVDGNRCCEKPLLGDIIGGIQQVSDLLVSCYIVSSYFVPTRPVSLRMTSNHIGQAVIDYHNLISCRLVPCRVESFRISYRFT